jgi:hypothetical protein
MIRDTSVAFSTPDLSAPMPIKTLDDAIIAIIPKLKD